MVRVLGRMLVLGCVLAASVPARSQQVGDAGEGRRMAGMWCSNCHATGAAEPADASDTPPSFRSVAQLKSTTAISVRAFLSTSHRSMPNFNLSDREIDDLTAYILSLRTR